METAPQPAAERYPGSAVLAAAIATFFFPVVSLIAALLLMSAQRSDAKRGQLRAWAWVSAAWILLQVVFFVVVFVAVSSGGSGGGGPIFER